MTFTPTGTRVTSMTPRLKPRFMRGFFRWRIMTLIYRPKNRPRTQPTGQRLLPSQRREGRCDSLDVGPPQSQGFYPRNGSEAVATCSTVYLSRERCFYPRNGSEAVATSQRVDKVATGSFLPAQRLGGRCDPIHSVNRLVVGVSTRATARRPLRRMRYRHSADTPVELNRFAVVGARDPIQTTL